MMLLICDIGRHYPNAQVELVPDSTSARLFEKIVEASVQGTLGGAASRFGWPREPDWPTAINDRVEVFAERLGLKLELLDGKTDPNDKDRTLDVAGRFSFGDDGDGCFIVLAQCALGKNWRQKRGEPTVEAWRNLIQWNAHLVRAVAIPWTLEEPYNYRRIFRHFDAAVVVDRPRLAAGAPDRHLVGPARDEIAAWCDARLAEVPMTG
jgi:hypothetical protein